MPLLPDLTFPDCNLCERGDRDSIRLLVRNAVDAPALLFHIHISEDLSGLLTRVVVQHPERWNSQTTYYFYIDMGGVYHGIDDLTWLRGNKTLTGMVFTVLYC
jgi:hypothetical protein